MSKNKLRKFAEMETFANVFQCGIRDENAISQVAQKKGHWSDDDKPLVLELGCGRGEYTVGLASLYPDKNFLGIDIKGARMWAGAKQALEQNITNAQFLRTQIELLPHFFADSEVDEIWITFPDPQMKKATKRLTSTYFLARYQKFLKNNGIVHLKTDSPFLFTYTCAVVKENDLPVVFETDDLYHSDFQDEVRNLKTHYENQWLERGMTIKYIAFRLPKDISLIEPDIDIEPDTYRSYGRNQRAV